MDLKEPENHSYRDYIRIVDIRNYRTAVNIVPNYWDYTNFTLTLV